MENQNQENEIELSTVEVSQFLAAALEYAEKGLSVFPLIPNGKRPITSNGFKDGTTDEQTIRNMWERSPDANVGIVTGGKSGIVVLDVDMKSGKNGFESLESLARETKIDTRATSTPSGGKHYYFRHPGTHISCSAGSLGDGLDVRADGGYIVAPPSVIDGVDYKWDDPGVSMAPCPNWLMSVKQRASASKVDGVVREGERNDLIFRLACSLRGRAIPYDEAEVEILTAASACDPPLPEEEALRCLISAYEYPEGDEFSKEILELNKKHAVVRIGGNCRILSEVFDPVLGLDDIAFSSTASFKELYGNRKVNEKKLAEAWLEHPGRRQYESIVFAPGAETPGYYNLWRGSPCKSQEGDCSLFLSHVKENIANGDEEIYNYIIAWMADVIQRPRDLPGVAIVLRGKQGTGKGVFANQFGKLFGKHYKHFAHEKHLTGNFNNHLKDAIFVFADEAFWGGRKDSEGALKALITEERLTIEGKGQDQYFVKNHIHLMMASNNEWVVCEIRSKLDTRSGFDWTLNPDFIGQAIRF